MNPTRIISLIAIIAALSACTSAPTPSGERTDAASGQPGESTAKAPEEESAAATEEQVDELFELLERDDMPSLGARIRELRESNPKAVDQFAVRLRERAEAAHPNLSDTLHLVVMTIDHPELVPYWKQVVRDPNSPWELVETAMAALVDHEAERAVPFFADIVNSRSGRVRWAATSWLIELLGRDSFEVVANALPLDKTAYKSEPRNNLDLHTIFFCAKYQKAMRKLDAADPIPLLERALNSGRWPAQVLALQCAQVYGSSASELAGSVSRLSPNMDPVPAWPEPITFGELADVTLAKISK